MIRVYVSNISLIGLTQRNLYLNYMLQTMVEKLFRPTPPFFLKTQKTVIAEQLSSYQSYYVSLFLLFPSITFVNNSIIANPQKALKQPGSHQDMHLRSSRLIAKFDPLSGPRVNFRQWSFSPEISFSVNLALNKRAFNVC